jgi:hypothetical protein
MNDIDDIGDNFDSPEAIRAMRRRHLKFGLRMQAVAIRALEELEEKMAAGKPLNLRSGDAKTLLDAGAKLEREALGEKERDADKASIPSPKKPN